MKTEQELLLDELDGLDGWLREAARAWAGAGLMSQMSMRQPSAWNFCTMPAPKPEPPPVMMATLPWRRGDGIAGWRVMCEA